MANRDNNIEVNLRLFQEKELSRLAQFAEEFRASVDILNKAMQDQSSQVARADSPRAASNQSSTAKNVGYQIVTRSEEIANQDAKVKARQSTSMYKARVSTVSTGISAEDIIQRQIESSSWAGRDIVTPSKSTPANVVSNTIANDIRYQTDSPIGESNRPRSVIGETIQRHRGTINAIAAGAGTGYALATAPRALYNHPIARTGQALGYERRGWWDVGTAGWESGLAGWWKGKKSSAFGFDPRISAAETQELSNMMASMGFDLNRPSNEKMFDTAVDLKKRYGLDTKQTAKFLEGVKRFNPQDMDKVNEELNKLGDSALKANQGIEAFGTAIMQGSEQLSAQYGSSKADYMKGLRKFGEETGLSPQIGAAYASNPDLAWWAASQRGGGFGAFYEATTNPQQIMDTMLPQIENQLGVKIEDINELSEDQQKEIKGKYAALMSSSPMFKSMTGGMSVEQLQMTSLRKTIDEKAGAKLISKKSFFGDANDDGKGGVSKSELEAAKETVFGGNTKAISLFEDMYAGMSKEEQAKELANMVGAQDAYAAKKTKEVMKGTIDLTERAAKFFHIIDDKGKFDPMATNVFIPSAAQPFVKAAGSAYNRFNR